MSKNIAAIDPGASGGFAWIDNTDETKIVKMPETEGDIVDQLRSIALDGVKALYIERIIPFSPNSSKLFGNARFIIGAAMTLNFRVVEVLPKTWQKRLGLGAKGEMTDRAWKNKLKAEAQRRFPHHKIILDTADAALLLEYAKEVER